jgi:uncharacterized membrane protein
MNIISNPDGVGKKQFISMGIVLLGIGYMFINTRVLERELSTIELALLGVALITGFVLSISKSKPSDRV